jgi:hypothetical protein
VLLQGLRLKRILPLLSLVSIFSLPKVVGEVKFVPVYEALVIKAHKNSPPHIAFEEVLSSIAAKSDWDRLEKIPSINLNIKENAASLYRTPASFLAKRVVLPEMVIAKNSNDVNLPPMEIASNGSSQNASDDSWLDELSAKQTQRLQQAQQRSEVLSQKWNEVPTWSDEAEAVLEKTGALVASSAGGQKVFVAGKTPGGEWQNQVPPLRRGTLDDAAPSSPSSDRVSEQASNDQNPNPDAEQGFLETHGQRTIVGPLEITGGLAVTNEHHLEVRRNDEGIYKELGRVDLSRGTYNIDVEETTGSVIARLVDKNGRILGEGSFRLSLLGSMKQNPTTGPKLKVEPRIDFSGIVTSSYNARPEDIAPPKTSVTFVKGASEVNPGKDGVVSMNNVARGSTTVMRVAAPNHLQTASLIVSGTEFKSQLYPETMIKSLQDLVGQQRNVSMEQQPTVIWGKISMDGKPVSGINVVVESDSDLVPVYFNQWMLPDQNLKSTSENGLYAFVDASPGFHSILATRASAVFGYQNVVVEEGSVAQGDIENTMKRETIPVRVYDAFNGSAIGAQLTMQSLDEDIFVENGSSALTLPQVSRWGLMQVQPASLEYARSLYFYNDKDSFIHIPLIKNAWLSEIKTYLRVNEVPDVGTIVGFVPDEDFEVYLAGYDNFPADQIVYFDMQGRILQNRKGISGGGFILYNVPDETHEVVVIGSRTGRMYSRVLPVDSGSVNVLSIRE